MRLGRADAPRGGSNSANSHNAVPNRMTSDARPPLLRIRNATVLKGLPPGRAVLDDLSLDIAPGEHTAILGPNGSGKSSLIKLLSQEYRPLVARGAHPTVQLFGRDRWDIFQLRRLMGIVSPDLHEDLTLGAEGHVLSGLDVVASGYFGTRGVQRFQQVSDAMWRDARAALALMDATHLCAKPMPEMSTGEARRVLIARALVPDPPALLLDEPTTGLDVVATSHFLRTLRGLARHGKTILFVTHHVHEIIPEVQRVVLLRAGKILLNGPKEDILTSERLSHAFESPLRVERTASGFYTMTLPVEEPIET